MKTYPILNQAPPHEDVCGSGGIAPRILNISARWRWVISFTPRPLYHRKRAPEPIGYDAGWIREPKMGLDNIFYV